MTIFFKVELVLQNIDMHEQRLAAAGGTPVCKLVDLRPGFSLCIKRSDLVGFGFLHIVSCNLYVQLPEERIRITEIAVKIDLGKKQGEILKVFPDNRLLPACDTPFIEPHGVADNILIIFQQ